MTPPRQHLATAIRQYAEWQRHCERIDAELATRESAALKTASADRAAATAALEQARRVNVSAEKLALQALMQSVERPSLTVAEAEAALVEMQARHDAAWDEIDMAKREAGRIRFGDLRAAERQRDEALGAVLAAEGLIDDLLRRYRDARLELGRLYLALAALPVLIRPTGQWETSLSLNELQTGDPSLANEIKAAIAALQIDPDAPLPGAPAPFPEAA